MYTLFAIMNDDIATGILRIDMSRETQEKVTNILNQQLNIFNDHHDRSVPFCAGYKTSFSEVFTIDNFTDSEDLYKYTSGKSNAVPFDPSIHSADKIKCLFTGNESTKL